MKATLQPGLEFTYLVAVPFPIFLDTGKGPVVEIIEDPSAYSI